MAQGQRQCAEPAYGMAEDAGASQSNRQLFANQGQELLDQVALHAPVPGLRCLRGIEVEARPKAEVPALCLAWHARAARAGVGRNQRETQLGPAKRCAPALIMKASAVQVRPAR